MSQTSYVALSKIRHAGTLRCLHLRLRRRGGCGFPRLRCRCSHAVGESDTDHQRIGWCVAHPRISPEGLQQVSLATAERATGSHREGQHHDSSHQERQGCQQARQRGALMAGSVVLLRLHPVATNQGFHLPPANNENDAQGSWKGLFQVVRPFPHLSPQ